MLFSLKFSKILTYFFLLLILITIFIFNNAANAGALYGLNLWYDHMIPALFPFMLLSKIMLKTGFASFLSSFFYPIVGKLFRISHYGVFVLIMGFLSGFPMAAQLVSSLIEEKNISKEEGEYLLLFCNNIGPMYLMGFLFPICPFISLQFILLVHFGVPLLYGLILRYTVYRNQIFVLNHFERQNNMSLSDSLNQAMLPSLMGITNLGILMIVFNTLQMLVSHMLYAFPAEAKGILACLIEITGGIHQISHDSRFYPLIYALLHFGGICCITQTIIFTKHCDFSTKKYVFHKIMQSILSGIIYYCI